MRYAIFLLALSGCGINTVRELYAPDGQPARYVECRGKYQCHQVAKDYCHGAYLPLHEESQTGAVGVASPSGGVLAPFIRYGLTFRCQ